MLEITPDKIAHVILRARERVETQRRSQRGELREFIEDLNEDEQASLVAVMWIGRESFAADELGEAIETARAERTSPTADYLMGEPQLADYLEAGMEALRLSPDEAEDAVMGRA